MPTGYFDIEEAFNDWEKRITATKDLTKSDIEELKAHLEDEYNTLVKTNLSKKEAFLVASNRLGTEKDWGDEFVESNRQINELKNVAIVCTGVIIYLFTYYLIRLIVAFIYIISIRSDYDLIKATIMSKVVVYGFLIIFGIFLVSIFLNQGKFLLKRINKLEIYSKYLIVIVIFALFLGIINHSIIPLLENYTRMAGGKNVLDHYFLLRRFEYIYFVQIIFAFILIYIKVIKKTELPT